MRNTLLAAGVIAFGSQPLAAQELPPEAGRPTVSVVTGVASDDILKIRVKASPTGAVMERVPNGSILKNFGCSDVNGYSWCRVEVVGNPEASGWTPARYLREAESGEAALVDLSTPVGAVADMATAPEPAPATIVAPDKAIITPVDATPAISTGTPAPAVAVVPLPAPPETTVVSAAPPVELPVETVAALPPAGESALSGTEAAQGTDATLPSPEAAEPNPPAAAVAPMAAPVPSAAPNRAMAAWDRIAEALIVGKPDAPTATEALPAAAEASPAASAPISAPAEPEAPTEPVGVAAPALAGPVRKGRRERPLAPPPVELSARLDASAGAVPALDAQRKSAETIGRTAAEDAYALAFAAMDDPRAVAMSEPEAASPEAADEAALAAPEFAPIPSGRPASPEVPAPDPVVVGMTAAPVAVTAVAVAASDPAAVEIPCARYIGQPMTRCAASVARTGEDDAEVTVAWPDGGARILRFRSGKPESSNARGALRATREGDLHLIRIGASERFEILDALVFGD